MSICQGGNGLPFMAEQVYDYLPLGKSTGLTFDKRNPRPHSSIYSTEGEVLTASQAHCQFFIITSWGSEDEARSQIWLL